ncbi:MAG: T9SS type A sorting domain-containing protein [Balneola sp.]
MKKLLFTISLVFFSFPLIAQESNPNFFHDLRGFEDSTGTTQLFYRLYEPKNRTCSYQEDGQTYTTNINPYKNHIYHLDTELNSDSVILRDYVQLSGFCQEIPYKIESYTFIDNKVTKPVAIYESVYGLSGSATLETYDENIFQIGIANPLGLNFQKSTNSLIVTSPIHEIVIKAVSGYDATLKKTYRFPLNQDSLWNEKNYYDDYPDSLLIDFSVLGVVDYNDDIFIGFKDSSLVLSYDSGDTSQVIIDNFFEKHSMLDASFEPLLIPPSPVFYLRNKANYIVNGVSSDIIRVREFGDFAGSRWEDHELLKNSENKRISIDYSNPDHLYLSDTTKVFFSEDYGESMQQILEFEEEVTGLYKKPDSDILYVLTKTDLYKVENGQPTSIKQVPVSNEESPEIPNAVSLKQNYPNPFNPTTTIEFELDKSTFTKLTVFDVLGRKVQELVNEIRPAGINTIEFNATNLASGVYLYRLEANGVVQTKRLTLIK